MIKKQKKITEAEPLPLSFNHIPLSLNYKVLSPMTTFLQLGVTDLYRRRNISGIVQDFFRQFYVFKDFVRRLSWILCYFALFFKKRKKFNVPLEEIKINYFPN